MAGFMRVDSSRDRWMVSAFTNRPLIKKEWESGFKGRESDG
jgi:hypothetical protein